MFDVVPSGSTLLMDWRPVMALEIRFSVEGGVISSFRIFSSVVSGMPLSMSSSSNWGTTVGSTGGRGGKRRGVLH